MCHYFEIFWVESPLTDVEIDFSKMPSEPENQKEESENIVGNLMIAEYQVEKLRSKVFEKIGKNGYAADKKYFAYVQR